VHAEYLPETRSGSPGQNSVKTKTAIHWLPVQASVPAEVRLYDRLFTEAQPDDKFQFERNGYFVADRKDHTAARPVFNLAVSLRDSWAGK
jgi:glutaminyl-tRNA synthetase